MTALKLTPRQIEVLLYIESQSANATPQPKTGLQYTVLWNKYASQPTLDVLSKHGLIYVEYEWTVKTAALRKAGREWLAAYHAAQQPTDAPQSEKG